MPAVVTFVVLAGDMRIGVLLLLAIWSVDIIGPLLTMDAVGELLLLLRRNRRVIGVLQGGGQARVLMVAGGVVIGSGCIVL